MNQEQIESASASQISQHLEHKDRLAGNMRTIVGLGFIGLGLGVTGLLAAGNLDDARFEQPMPFNEQAQDAINNVDDILADAGKMALPGGLLFIGAVKLGASRNNRLRSIDKRSSQELSDDGRSKPGLMRRSLRTVAAGSMPVVVGASAAVGTLTSAIGNEITEGPSRPIVAFDKFAPGETMVTQYDAALPMLDSKLSHELAEAIKTQASLEGALATSISIGLNSLQYDGKHRTALSIGVDPEKVPPALQLRDCDQVPVLIDTASDIAIGNTIKINGVEAQVVGEVSNVSATNRIGVVMSQESLETCINKNDEVQSHAVVLDTDATTAAEILSSANDSEEVATVITKEKYVENSEDFWESNVKPITNTLALVALMTSFIAMSGNAMSRLLRNRRELAAKLAAGESVNQFRVTEILRATKEGVLGSSVGVAAGGAAVTLVNVLEPGMRVGLSLQSAMVGYAVGVIGSVAGAALHVVRPNKVVDPSEHTRV